MDSFIKVSNDSVLVLVTSGMFTTCRICGKEINGGEACYSEQTNTGTTVTVKPPVCVDCARKMAPQ
ncbi:MAG: hypothetical protein QXU18_00320 [Thermoplasmatales archaeon]